MAFEGELTQTFTVTITWSPEADARLTEGDIREVVEEMASEIDEDSVVEVTEHVV